MEVSIQGQPHYNQIPEPQPLLQQLLDLAKVQLPEALACGDVTAATRKELKRNIYIVYIYIFVVDNQP